MKMYWLDAKNKGWVASRTARGFYGSGTWEAGGENWYLALGSVEVV